MKPDLAAPTAVAVVGGYFSGTSAAAPHVGGEAALIWSQVAATTSGDVANAVAARLRAIALDSGPPGPDLLWGTGRTRVDTVAPALGPTTPEAAGAVAGAVPFTLPLVEAGTLDSTAVALEGAPITATLGADRVLTGSLDSHGLADGLHQLTVSASDQSGNTATLAVPFRVDNSGPTLSTTAASAGTPVSGVDRLQVPLLDPSGIASASASLDATPIASSLADSTLTASIDTRGTGDGAHRIAIHATDRLGNRATLELPLVVDNTPPRLALAAAGEVLAGALYRVAADAADELAGLSGSPRVAFGDGSSAAVPATHRYRRSGNMLVRVTTSDRAGNTATVSRPLRVIELRLAPRRGAVIVTVGRRDVVHFSSGRFHLRRVLSPGSHRVRLVGLRRGRHVVTAEARGFRARAIVRVP
jgi:Subtilase family